MLELLEYAFGFLQDCFTSRQKLALENLALRSQLARYQEKQRKGIVSKPRCTPAFRLTWVILRRVFARWQDVLLVVKPETVIRWHDAGFRSFWRHKSRRKNGRPVVSAEMRRLIKKIATDNPLWSPERIHDQLVELGYSPCK